MSRNQERRFVGLEFFDEVFDSVVDYFRRPAFGVKRVGFRFRGLATPFAF
jgi:hypothetical protein